MSNPISIPPTEQDWITNPAASLAQVQAMAQTAINDRATGEAIAMGIMGQVAAALVPIAAVAPIPEAPIAAAGLQLLSQTLAQTSGNTAAKLTTAQQAAITNGSSAIISAIQSKASGLQLVPAIAAVGTAAATLITPPAPAPATTASTSGPGPAPVPAAPTPAVDPALVAAVIAAIQAQASHILATPVVASASGLPAAS